MIHLLLLVPVFFKDIFVAILAGIAERFVKHSHSHKKLQIEKVLNAEAYEKRLAEKASAYEALQAAQGQVLTEIDGLWMKYHELGGRLISKDAELKKIQDTLKSLGASAIAFEATAKQAQAAREIEANQATETEMRLYNEIDGLKAKLRKARAQLRARKVK